MRSKFYNFLISNGDLTNMAENFKFVKNGPKILYFYLVLNLSSLEIFIKPYNLIDFGYI